MGCLQGPLSHADPALQLGSTPSVTIFRAPIRPPSRRPGPRMEDSDSSKRSMRVAPIFVKTSARRAQMGLCASISTKTGAAGRARFAEPDSAFLAAGGG